MKKFDAVGNNVMVALLAPEEQKTEGGILMPQTTELPQKYGKVISVGKDVDLGIEVGDIITFHRNAGMDMMESNIIYKVIKSEEVYAIVKED